MMTSRDLLANASLVTAIGCAVVGGLMLAFSLAVMPGLARLPPAHGIAAMQAINVAILTRVFLALFVGTALAGLVIAGASIKFWEPTATPLRIAGALLYAGGVIALTRGVHLPLNDALATADPNSTAGAEQWASYLASWTPWNHVRGIAAVLAAVAFAWSSRTGRI